MKYKISKVEFEKLSEEMQALYKLNGETATLIVEDADADDLFPELSKAKRREAQNYNEEKQRAEKLQKELDAIKGDDARKRGDIDTLEKSWKTKNEAEVAAEKEKTNKYKGLLEKTLVSDVASQIAAKLSPNHIRLLLPHIKARLTADFDADEPETRVLDANGKLSAMSVADLEKEFRTNPDFASIIVGSNASGSGANGNRGGGAPKKLAEMNDAERVQFYKDDPEGFKRAKEALKQSAH